MKPKVIFFPLDMKSHILRCAQLAGAIKPHFDVLIASGGFCDLIRELGFEAAHYPALSGERVLELSRRRVHGGWMQEEVLQPPLMAQIELIHRHSPGWIVNDTSFTAQMAAEAARVPCVSLVNGLFSRFLAIPRPAPMRHPAYSLARLLPARLTDFAASLVFRHIHTGYARLRRKFGLKERPDHLSEFTGDFNFILDSPEFAPQRNLPENHVQIGPLFHRSDGDESEVLRQLDPAKKTILVNLGGSGESANLGFLSHPGFQRFNVISVGWGRSAFTGPGVISRKFLHLDSVLPRVDLVLTQGGTGNLFHSWSYGIPTLCFPTFFEQDWNAARVMDLKLGTAFLARPAEAEAIDTVEHWLARKQDGRFKKVAGSIDLQATRNAFANRFRALAG